MDVEPHIQVVEFGIETAKIDIVDIFENKRRRLTLQIPGENKPHHVSKNVQIRGKHSHLEKTARVKGGV